MSDGAAWSAAAPQAADLITGLAPFVALIAGIFLALTLGAYMVRYFNGRKSAQSVSGTGGSGGVVFGGGLPGAAVKGGRVDAADLGRSVGETVAKATADRELTQDHAAWRVNHPQAGAHLLDPEGMPSHRNRRA